MIDRAQHHGQLRQLREALIFVLLDPIKTTPLRNHSNRNLCRIILWPKVFRGQPGLRVTEGRLNSEHGIDDKIACPANV